MMTTPSGKILVYRAKDGWRWQARCRNGRIVAESGEAYRGRISCAGAAASFGPPRWPVVYDGRPQKRTLQP